MQFFFLCKDKVHEQVCGILMKKRGQATFLLLIMSEKKNVSNSYKKVACPLLSIPPDSFIQLFMSSSID
jgi:hypothetical protein